MKDYQVRVIKEKADLDEKIGELSTSIYNENFLQLEVDEQYRMKMQLKIMSNYSSILGERITEFRT